MVNAWANLSSQLPYGLAVHSRCLPGTEREVINIVTHLNRNTDPNIENNLLRMIARYLWNNNITQNMIMRTRPQYSHMANAHGMKGILSSTMSSVDHR